MKFNIKSRKGFTLIELLVVIGILAVLAAIAIPSVAGLIDRANVSADNTNANEYTNSMERFASEYELYCQDIASGAIKDEDGDGVPDNMDASQGRVYNVTKAVTRTDITKLESCGFKGNRIDKSTKYPSNEQTIRNVIENYTKTSSSTFEPKQSDMHYWYSPDCGITICASQNSTVSNLNDIVKNKVDAGGKELTINSEWINITDNSRSFNVKQQDNVLVFGKKYIGERWQTKNSSIYMIPELTIFEDGTAHLKQTFYNINTNEITEILDGNTGHFIFNADFSYAEHDGHNSGAVCFRVLDGGSTLYYTQYGQSIYMHLQ